MLFWGMYCNPKLRGAYDLDVGKGGSGLRPWALFGLPLRWKAQGNPTLRHVFRKNAGMKWTFPVGRSYRMLSRYTGIPLSAPLALHRVFVF